MKTNKKIFLLPFALCVFSVYHSNAQAQLTPQTYYVTDALGHTVTLNAYDDIQGTPYLADTWAPGTVKLTNGKTYKDNVLLKYNLADDAVYFKGENGSPLLFASPVSEFTITDETGNRHYKSGFDAISGYTDKNFFEVIADGTVQVLKKYKKTVRESRDYNSAVTVKAFVDIIQYYMIKNGKVVSIKNDKKTILTAIGDKQPELEAYIKANNLNLKNDADIGKLVTYYNSI